jgi:hypothetical protein
MGLEVHVAPPPVGDVCVPLGRPEVGVPEHLLNRSEIRATFEKVGRERVAQKMGMDAAGLEAGTVCKLAQDEEGAGAGERASARVQEEFRAIAAVEVRATEREIATHGFRSGPPERDEALLPALSEHADDAFLDGDAALLQAGRFRHAKAGAVEQLHERAVSERARRRPGGRVDQPFGLRGRERTR